ncbi:hypothetical protein TRVL_05099 [Trypanosoma vivax]|nr:hypothetical protein TRVL_05099 [Trypanosoma vivax]
MSEMLKVVPSALRFGAVAVNEAPSYCRFCIQNTDPSISLLIQLRTTTLSDAIQFQLWDDKMKLDDDIDDNDTCDVAKTHRTTVKKSTTYNAVFDSINIIERLTLGPYETREIVAIFRALPGIFSNIMEHAPPTLVSGCIQVTSTSLPETSTHLPMNEEKKDKIISATSVSQQRYEKTDSTTSFSTSSIDNSLITKEDENVIPPSIQFTRSPFQTAVRSETVTLPFSANVFLSSLVVSKSELQVTMTPNRTQLIGFSVRNTSALPLLFVIRMQTMPHKNVEIAVYEEEKFEMPQIGRTLVLDRHASMNFTVMIRTAAFATETTNSNEAIQSFHHRAVLQCDNLRDSRNSELVYVNVNVVAEDFKTDLVSVTNSALDFGAVYRGTPVVREVTFCNISRENVTIRLVDQRPRHCEGTITIVRAASDSSNKVDVETRNNNGSTINEQCPTSTNTVVSGSSSSSFLGNVVPVDEVVVMPQKSGFRVGVMYVPSTDRDYKGTANLKFELDFIVTGCEGGSGGNSSNYATRQQQRVVVRCVASLFTSTIVASPMNINFGDCLVGESRRCKFDIENPSPLPTTVRVMLRSKVVSIEGVPPRNSATGGRETVGEFSIAPRSNLSLTLRISPQRVNPIYCKQLTIVNVSNPAEDRLIVNIEANNMAPSEAEIHNELYTCECRPLIRDGCSNFTAAGGGSNGKNAEGHSDDESQLRAIATVPLIVAYAVCSKVDHPLALQLHTTGQEVDTFCLEGMPTNEFEGLAAELRLYCCFGSEDMAGKLIPERAEELLVNMMRALQNYAIPTKCLTLNPRSSSTFYVRIQRSTNIGVDVVTKEDGVNIVVENIELPRFMRLSYKVCSSRFELGGQKTKHFGEINVGERKTTKLPIINQCNSVLLLRVTKSRSVMAGYIRMDNSDRNSIYFRIRPFATKELELAFCPGLKGILEERIHFTNVLSPINEVTMTVKATVTKAETFDVSPDSWSFGRVPVPRLNQVDDPVVSAATPELCKWGLAHREDPGRSSTCVRVRFTVCNTSASRRALRLKLDSSTCVNATGSSASGCNAVGGGSSIVGSGGGCTDPAPGQSERPFKFEGIDVRLHLEMERGASNSSSSRKLAEKIEKLEQKLKIYRRKNKMEKATATMKQIEELKHALTGEVVDIDAAEEADGSGNGGSIQQEQRSQLVHPGGSVNESEGALANSKVQVHGDLFTVLSGDGVALSEMNAGESTILVLGLVFIRTTEHIPPVQSGAISLLLYEENDTETSRVVPVDVTLVREEEIDIIDPVTPGATTPPLCSKLATDEAALGNAFMNRSSVQSSRAPSKRKNRPHPATQHSLDVNTVVASQTSTGLEEGNISLSSIMVEAGSGVAATTFMRFPAAFIGKCVVYERCEFTVLVRATMDTPVVVLQPFRCAQGGSASCHCISAGSTNNSEVAQDCNNATGSEHAAAQSGSSGCGFPVQAMNYASPAASSLSISLMDAQFKFSERAGTACMERPFCITVECTPISTGPQRYVIPVRNLHNGSVSYLAVELHAVNQEDIQLLKVFPVALGFRDIIVPYIEDQLEVQSLSVRSSLPQPHALLVRSNRPALVQLFEDVKCKVPLKNPLQRAHLQGKVTVYVRLSPSEHARRHTCRMVTAGILVEAIASVRCSCESGEATHDKRVGYAVLAQSTVRVSACIGSGELALANTFIDIGAVPPHCQQARTTVVVSNPSDRFELQARLSPALASTRLGSSELTLAPGCSVEVPITLQLPTSGLVRESVTLHNLSCKQKPLIFRIVALKHDEAISAAIMKEGLVSHDSTEAHRPSTQRGCGCATLEKSIDDYCLGDTLTFQTASVVLGEDGTLRLHKPVSGTGMQITNHSALDLVLIAMSGAPLFFGCSNSSSLLHPPTHCEGVATHTSLTNSGCVSSGLLFSDGDIEKETDADANPLSHVYPCGRVRIEARRTEAVVWMLTELPPITVKQKQQLLRHELVTMEVTAQVCIGQVLSEGAGFNFNAMMFPTTRALPVTGQCVLMPKFLLKFALSEGRVEPLYVDVGVVGVKKTTEDVPQQSTCSPTTVHSAPCASDAISHTSQGSPGVPVSTAPWKDERDKGHGGSPLVSFHLTNLSPELPLHLNVECEPTVRFASNRITVLPLQTVRVEAVLVPKLIQTQGPFRLAVFFVNELNPENDMVVYVTGQYYRKVFELSCEETMDDRRESLSMQPLRVEDPATASLAVLSQTKVTLTAMESNVEVGVRVTTTPKLEGIIQLQALQYDTATTLQSLVFGQCQHAANANSVNNVAVTNANTSTGNTGGGNINNNNGGVSGGGSTGMISNVLGVNNSICPTSAGHVGGSGGVNSGGGTVTNSSFSSALASIPPGRSSNSKQREQQSFRLRCVLVKEDFAALASAFFAQRKNKATADVVRERGSLTFDKVIEGERRRPATSPLMWLGTLHFSDALTGTDEEVQIFGSLSAFPTFTVAPKLLLRPHCTVAVPTMRKVIELYGGVDHLRSMLTSSEALQLYSGEMDVVNPCKQHSVLLSVTPLLDQAYHGGIFVHCEQLEDDTHQATGGFVDVATGNGEACSVDIGEGLFACSPPFAAAPMGAEGQRIGRSTSDTVVLSVAPMGKRRVRVHLVLDKGRHQPKVEQVVVLALFDETVPCSHAVVRMLLAHEDGCTASHEGETQQLLRRPLCHASSLLGTGSRDLSSAHASSHVATGDNVTESDAAQVAFPEGGAGNLTAVASLLAEHFPGGMESGKSKVTGRVLSLRGNCTEVSDCGGVYACNYSFATASPPATDIMIHNNLTDTVVKYTITVISQRPQPWLLLPVASAVLGPGEVQPLRLNILSTDAGSFIGHLSITNNITPGEVLLLMLKAEVFLSTAGEGLFDILASDGQRLSNGAEQQIFIGQLFGEKTHRAYAALEIVNRSCVPLEFPLTVLRPFRMEFKNAPGEETDVEDTVGDEASKSASDAFVVDAATVGQCVFSEAEENDLEGCRSRRTLGEGEESKSSAAVEDRSQCDVRLLVCRLPGVSATREGSFKIDPNSRVKVAFLLVCDRLQLANGLVAHGEAEVVFKCKQARDARFFFKAHFQVCKPSFAVQRQLFFTHAEDYAVSLAITNLRHSKLQVVFYTSSTILDIQRGPSLEREDRGESEDILLTIPASTTVVVRIRLDISRIATLCNWNSGNNMEHGTIDGIDVLLPPLYEYGVLLNAHNPSERARVELCYLPSSTHQTQQMSSIYVDSTRTYPLSKAIKAAQRRHCHERLCRFVLQFWRALTEIAEFLLPKIKQCASEKDFKEPHAANEPSKEHGSASESLGESDGNMNISSGKTENGSGISGEYTCTKDGNLKLEESNKTRQNQRDDTNTKKTTNKKYIDVLRSLLNELSWLVDEVIYASIFQNDQKTIENYGIYLTMFISTHPLMKTWGSYRANVADAQIANTLEQIMETIKVLPCPATLAL